MDAAYVLTTGQQAVQLLLSVSAPLLGVILAVGLIVSVLQAMTQIHEATLSFVPKLLAAAATLVLAGPWMLDTLVDHLRRVLMALPTAVQ